MGKKYRTRLINVSDAPITWDFSGGWLHMATAASLIFSRNVALAEESLGINPDHGHRVFTPVAFRVGQNQNVAGTAVDVLKLLLWATQRKKGVNKRMTLGEFMSHFEEYWEGTARGERAPSWLDHWNLYELWRLWQECPTTLVSDVFELYGRPIRRKELHTT